MLFGTELIIDAADCGKYEIKSKKNIQNFIDELVKTMNMKKVGETIFEYFEDNQFNRERDIVGYSVVQIISLSSITLHINEISKTIYCNIFTCGKMDELKLIILFGDYFKSTKIKKRLLERDALS